MHVHFEQNTCTRTDSNFLSLSWMGKVPEDLPEEGGGWKLNRAQYYVEGWLASGNSRGIVGVTFSTSHCHAYNAPPRSNFNLRGHRSEVVLVRWNEPYQKLATCDSRGVIFVWIKHEGRWSIELINDRNSQVTDFAWSHDGRMALICYRDGFILVGSVAGQRYWSSMLNLENTSITCGVWSPDDQQVMFGTLDGQIIVMSSTGMVVTQVTVHEGFEITSMAWSCEKFNMEEADSVRDGTDHTNRDANQKSHVLAVCFKYGDIFLMSGYDDICPIMVYTTLTGVKIDWSNCGEYLAVGGFVRLPNLQCRNEVHFYSKDGNLIHWVNLPSQGKPLTAMTWGHNDKRLFIAAGCHMYVAWVSKQVAPLHFLCQRIIHQSVHTEKAVDKLPLPQRLKCGVKALFSPTIKSYIPDPLRLREFVCGPPPGGERLFCTMIRHGEETSGGHYTLYLEYLGGLVPLLKGKRASKLRPDFIIFDPKIKSSGKESSQKSGIVVSDPSSESESEIYSDGCGSPRMQRRRRNKVFRAEKVDRSITFRTLDELMYDDNLPETNRLVEVTSNIWGTKFQITGLSSSLPACLGQVVYKTSLLHLQPRQMTIAITEITPTRPVLSRDPNFTPAPYSTDGDDDMWTSEGDLAGERKTVEVTVHDDPSCRRDRRSLSDRANKQESSSVDSRTTEAVAPHNEDLLSNATKQSCPEGTDAITQSTPNLLQERVCRDNWHEANSMQGARPKACLNMHQFNSKSPHISNKTNIPNSISKVNGGGNNKCAAIPNNNHSSANFNSHYANGNIVMSHFNQTCNKKVESFISSSPVTAGNKKLENVPGFKRVDVGNCIDVGRGCGISIDSLWRSDELNSPALVVNHSALSQHDSGSSSTSAKDVMMPLTAIEVGPRWADPAAEAGKLFEEGTTEGSDAPFENNLVADCSPTTPNCQDLHRRLYLAQQNSLDTGAPISPSSCPACQPVQYTSGTDLCSSIPSANPQSDSAIGAQYKRTDTADSGQIQEGCTAELQTIYSKRQCPIHDSAYSVQAMEGLSTDYKLTEQSPLAIRNVMPSHKDQSQSLFTTCKNRLPQEAALQHDHSYLQQSPPNVVRYSGTCHHCLPNVALSLAGLITSNKQTALQHQSHHISPVDGYLSFADIRQKQENKSPSSSTNSQEHELSSPVFQQPNSTPQTSITSYPALPKDLTSFEKLCLILSEDQSTQRSVHNFRSMPGFVMKNPDFKDNEDKSSITDTDFYEYSNDQLPSLFPCNENFVQNNIHDFEIQQTSASLPSSPLRFGAKQNPNTQKLHEEILKGRCRHLSPLLGRKGRGKPVSSADFLGFDDPKLNSYENLEAFQKAQLKQKVRRRLNEASSRLEPTRTFTMHNKAPLWNETSQVYQLDFGGRVTQESAKNFQIELKGKQVMQFGRIDNNAYTLDFQYPFTAIQAFAVALANVTQRLK